MDIQFLQQSFEEEDFGAQPGEVEASGGHQDDALRRGGEDIFGSAAALQIRDGIFPCIAKFEQFILHLLQFRPSDADIFDFEDNACQFIVASEPFKFFEEPVEGFG